LLSDLRRAAARRELIEPQLDGGLLCLTLGLVETAHRVMVAVFDGDPKPIFEIILDPEAEEFVRSRMCEALAMLVLRSEAVRGSER
jgi:L-asparaginase II